MLSKNAKNCIFRISESEICMDIISMTYNYHFVLFPDAAKYITLCVQHIIYTDEFLPKYAAYAFPEYYHHCKTYPKTQTFAIFIDPV